MSEEDARQLFIEWRFKANGGKPVCAHCQCDAVYTYKCRPIFKCKACLRQFSATTNTVFADRKLSFRQLLIAIGRIVTTAKGINAIELANALRVEYKTSFVLAHKLRSVMDAEASTVVLEGTVEIDGAEIGGYIRPKNVRKKKGDFWRYPYRHNSRKQVAIAMTERGGRTLSFVAKSESAAVPDIRARLRKGAVIHADSAACWNVLEAHFSMKRINHKECFWTPEASTNGSENFFSLMRRTANGTHHHISGKYLHHYLARLAWRKSFRLLSNRTLVESACALIGQFNPRDMKGYWQRSRKESTT